MELEVVHANFRIGGSRGGWGQRTRGEVAAVISDKSNSSTLSKLIACLRYRGTAG